MENPGWFFRVQDLIGKVTDKVVISYRQRPLLKLYRLKRWPYFVSVTFCSCRDGVDWTGRYPFNPRGYFYSVPGVFLICPRGDFCSFPGVIFYLFPGWFLFHLRGYCYSVTEVIFIPSPGWFLLCPRVSTSISGYCRTNVWIHYFVELN